MHAQHNLSRLLREVELGEEILITRRKEVVAKISPPPTLDQIQFPDFLARGKRTWGEGWKGSSTDQLLNEGRGER